MLSLPPGVVFTRVALTSDVMDETLKDIIARYRAERRRAANRRYYHSNKSRFRERYERDREERREYAALYRKLNRDKYLESQRRYNEKRKSRDRED